jgi:crossover junction endodeoxyribonuclease RusA
MEKSLILELPLPPSINGGYWSFHGHRRFLTPKANQFKADVARIVSLESIRFGSARLCLTATFFFPTKRVADISNRIKALEDALVQAGLMDDDSQIDEIHVYRGAIHKGGKTLVEINVLE